MNIAVLYGGKSSEHEVSLVSAASVLKNLDVKYNVLPIGINRNGQWFLQDMYAGKTGVIPDSLDIEENPENTVCIIPSEGFRTAGGKKINIDAVFPVLHGSFGEDGTVQGLLEIAGIPYVGSGVLGSSLGMDKDTAKKVWKASGLPVVPWITLKKGSSNLYNTDFAEKVFSRLGPSVFVKPANAGSSVGVSKADSSSKLLEAINTAMKFDRKILIEKAVSGREIECAVIGYDKPEAFEPGEIITKDNYEFYDYTAKYKDPESAELKVPAELEKDISRKIKDTALKAYAAVEAGGFARVDFLVEGEKIYINEINTIPGLTPISLYPRMAAFSGLNFTGMLDTLIQSALKYPEN